MSDPVSNGADPALVDDDEAMLEYGPEPPPMWFSSTHFDGQAYLTARRPEIAGDSCGALFADLTAWVDWLVHTFRLQGRIPPCWIRHPALVEELLALFFLWQHSWIPAQNASLPIGFLRELDWSLGRIERYWKVPCDQTEHKAQAPVTFTTSGVPTMRAWWSNPDYDDSDDAVPSTTGGAVGGAR